MRLRGGSPTLLVLIRGDTRTFERSPLGTLKWVVSSRLPFRRALTSAPFNRWLTRVTGIAFSSASLSSRPNRGFQLEVGHCHLGSPNKIPAV